MKKQWLLVSALLVVLVFGTLALIFIPTPKVAEAPAPNQGNTATSTPASLDDLVVVTSPLPNTIIGSTTVTITGKARGSWYFEAQFPVELFENEPGSALIGNAIAHAQGDWTTQDYVPFTATITFNTSFGVTDGELVLHNDNPSGDPSRAKELRIPVKFIPK